MPYIVQEQRPDLDALVDQFPELDDGQLNYVYTKLAHKCIKERGLRYAHLNAVCGVFTCALAEFIRRVVSPYEDEKARLNGNVSELDANEM